MLNSVSLAKLPIALLTAACTLAFTQVSTATPSPALQASPEHSRTAKDILATLGKKHYRQQPLNDALSSRLFDEYLDNLDPAKSYLLQSDIAEYEGLRKQLDDELNQGKLDSGFTLFNRFNERLNSRIEWQLEKLQDPTFKVDFSRDESVELDVEKRQWAQSKEELNEFWRKRLKSALLNLKLSDKTLEEAKTSLIRRYKNQLKRVKQQTATDAFESYMNALGALYDPHTNYFAPRTAENFNISMSLSLEGIGAVLQTEDEYTKVVRLVAAGPADKEGNLKAADKITAVGQGKEGEMVDVIGWRLDEVVDLIRGKKGSLVRLQLIPVDGGEAAQKTITIKRNKVKLEDQAAQKAVFEVSDGDKLYKVGVIDLPTFYIDFDACRKRLPDCKSTTGDVFKLVKELQQAKVDGIILDLRNNGGGSLQEAALLTEMFIDPGTVVQIRHANNSISRALRARQPAFYRGPLLVLTNRLSASASEIFAGAIQDYGRGLIVGAQTFGKGTVQSLMPVNEGRLKITESRFYRVSGDSTQHRGVIPDINFPSMVDISEVGESAYDNALPWDKIHAAPHGRYFDINSYVDNLTSLHNKRTKKDPDFQLLLEQIDVIKARRADTILSLNEQQRLDEKLVRESQAFELENKRRVGKGMTAIENLETFKANNKAEQEEASATPTANVTRINPDKDTLLTESGYILADFIRMQKDRHAQRIANAIGKNTDSSN